MFFSFFAFAGPVRAADVVVVLGADVDAYHKAVKGFREATKSSGHRIVKTYDMKGDFNIGKKILAEIESEIKPDLIYVVGIWGLQLVIKHKAASPVVYSMVLNPPSVIGSGTTNITGASMNVPVATTFQLFKQLSPKIRRVGTVFSQARTGYLIKEAEQVAKKLGLQLVAKQIHSPKQAIAALKSLRQEGIDALWIVPDKTVLDPNVVKQMLLFSYRQKVPLLGLSQRQAKMGSLLSLSFASSEDIGKQAGELANRILEGSSAADVHYTTARKVHLIVNLKAARKLEIKVPEALMTGQIEQKTTKPRINMQVIVIK